MSFGATTYSHFAGTGRRDWLIEVSTTCNITNGPISNIVDGVKANNNTDGVFCNSAESGREFKFKFPWQVRIDEFTWTQDAAGTQGTWKIAGSNDDVSYTDLGTGINLGGAAAADVHAFTNPDGYQYYKLIQTAGTTTNSRWIQEIEFKVSLDSAYPAGGSAIGPTSYSNLDGTGNRSARMLMLLDVATACGGSDVGNMNAMLNGVTGAQNCTDAAALPNSGAGHYITIYFREPLVIDEFTWKQSIASNHGTWKIQGSHDNSSYTDIATGLTWGTTTADAVAFTNATAYNFYRLVQTSGNLNFNPWNYEIEFKTSTATSAAPPPTPHYFAAGVAVEVMSNGDGSSALTAGVAVEVMNTGDGSTAYVGGTALEILSSVALAPKRAFDGSKIYEFGFAFQPENRYSEADWDSIYSIGDRTHNGTLTWTQGGWATTTGNVTQLSDYNWGLSGGNGFGMGGQSGWPAGAFVGFETADGSFQFVSGFRLFGLFGIGGDMIMFGGYDGQVWAVNHLNFDQFYYGGGSGATFEFDVPFFPFNYWSFTLASVAEPSSTNYPGGDMGPEIMLKVYHSVLDGGDRRPSNGRAIKRVVISVSSGIEPNNDPGAGFNALENLVDGRYFPSNGGPNPPTYKSTATVLRRVGWTSGDEAILAAGEYIQFAFPRKVFMREMVWNVGGQEVLSGGEPTIYGKWQWYASNAANSGYIAIGDPWHFAPGSNWMKAPKPLPDSAYNETSIYPYWRMVLVEGPAFGGGTNGNIAQIQFNLIDPDNQDPLYEIAFTDGDSDIMLGTVTNTAADPNKYPLTDGDSDALSGTITIINNLVLTAAFTDGDSDALFGRSSLSSSTVVQTFSIVKGR